ncbi:MAG: hypothetical protein IJR02_05815 [Bacteroidaceae bacterium]|nr:hypothetical protein [Bacteroidaceae bacterium]MBQ6750272.1 hypothetical protein [Bacteroidaceae bacterium]
MKKLLLLGMMLLSTMVGVVNAQETKTPILLTGGSEGVTIEPIAPSTMAELYAATFTPSASFQNMFQYKNFETGDYQKIVIKFGAPVPNGWHIHTYGGQFDGNVNLGGKTEYEVNLTGANIDDFTIFNWDVMEPITISEVYFYKNESVPENATKTPILLTGGKAGVTIEPIAPSTLEELYAATFTPLEDFQNIFQYLNMEVGDYQKIVIKFGAPVPEGWNINEYGGFKSIAGKTEYEIALNGSPIEDFTIFNWYGCRAPITITEAYFYKEGEESSTETIIVAKGFGEEITSLDYIIEGGNFVISDNGTKAKFFLSNQNSQNDAVTDLSIDAFFNCTLEKVEDSGVDGNNIYRIHVKNMDGNDYNKGINGGSYINTPNSGWSIVFAGDSKVDGGHKYGTDADLLGLWFVTYDPEKGFSFQNVGKATNGQGWPSWMTVADLSGEQAYIKLYKSVVFEEKVIDKVVKEDNAANDEIFALSKATGYDTETGVMTNGGWTFEEPVSILDWDYIVITTSNTAADASHEISITDENGKKVNGEGYAGGTAQTGGNMWLDRWNNQNAIRISVDYLRLDKGMDVKKIKSLTINGAISIGSVYLTDFNNTKIKGGYANGDVVREYNETGKFGTICLPYVASCAGAEIYAIAGTDENGIALTKVEGLLEAGKPYFYMASDENGLNNEHNVRNVNIFRADLEKFDVTVAGENNGLIGTFESIVAPQGDNFYVLSGNQLYYTTGATVNVGANKAYIDMSKIAASEAKAAVTLNFGETTRIENIKAAELLKNGKIYDISGREVSHPTRGLYIVNGKKVMIQ